MLTRIRVSTGLFVLLFVFCAVQLVSSSVSFTAFKTDYQNFTRVETVSQQRDSLSQSWVALLQTRNTLNRAATRAARSVPQEQVSVLMNSARTSLAQADVYFKQFVATTQLTEEGERLAEGTKASYNKLNGALAELIGFLDKGQLQPFLDQPTQSFQDNFEKHFSAYLSYVQTHLQQASQASRDSYDHSTWSFGIVVVLSLALVVVAVVWLRKIILTPLTIMRKHFEHIAQGYLTVKIADYGQNEIGVMFAALQHMQTALSSTVHTVRQGATGMLLGVREISSGNVDLSSRTESQASALEQTAASMEQLTAIVKQNADNAHQASKLAQETTHTAHKGGEISAGVVKTMQDIAVSSRKISDITGVIDSIAFQTNILALNAAVEAARAGDQGRGFAVVAGEVRSLAQRSAQAAKEIKALIEESVGRVEQGSVLVKDAGNTMDDIVTSVKRVTDIMGEIASASDEQSRGIEQVAQAVTEMDSATQQNAALVEEASSAVQALEAQAMMLTDAVSVFRLDVTDDERSTNTYKVTPALALKERLD